MSKSVASESEFDNGELSDSGREILSSPGSITQAYVRLSQGDRDAFTRIAEYFWPKLVARAGCVVPRSRRQAVGLSDAAQDALNSFWPRAMHQEFTDINSRKDIFCILSVMVVRKACTVLRGELRQKRGGGKVKQGGTLPHHSRAKPGQSPEPGPAEEAEFQDLLDRLIAVLPEKGDLRAVGREYLIYGLSAPLIRRKLQLEVKVEAVQRKVQKAIRIWRKEMKQIDSAIAG